MDKIYQVRKVRTHIISAFTAILLLASAGCDRDKEDKEYIRSHIYERAHGVVVFAASKVRRYAKIYGSLPDPEDFARIIADKFSSLEGYHYFVQRGHRAYFADPWDEPLVLRVLDDGSAVVISFGFNSIDDGGQKDDIVHPVRNWKE